MFDTPADGKNTRIILKRFIEGLVIVAVLVGSVLTYKRVTAEQKAQYVVEQNATCPSLLSIARSARDTLIVMKNKEMCTQYMLDHLK